MKEQPNTLMVLTNPDAAQSVLRSLCLLSGLAAHQHVGRAKFDELRGPALPRVRGHTDWTPFLKAHLR
jgi:hypothetical protein